MSDESALPPPALRLKPRLRPAEGTPEPPSAVVGETLVAGTPGAEPPALVPAVAALPPTIVFASPLSSEPQAIATPNDTVKFKFKPKAPSTGEAPAPPQQGPLATPPAIPAVIPAVVLPVSVPAVTIPVPVDGGPQRKSLPPFPVMAPSRTGPTAPPRPVPHLSVRGLVNEPETVLVVHRMPARGTRWPLFTIASVGVVAAAVYFGRPYFESKHQAMPKPVVSVPAAAPAPGPALAAPPISAPASGPTPSATLNELARVPVNAINKAQDAIAARRASEQSRVDAALNGNDVPDGPARKVLSATSKSTPTMTHVGPGLSAAEPIEEGSAASPEARLFVAKARISGVFQGHPARAMINGRLARPGDRIDVKLGVTFEGLNGDRRQLIFADRSGAKIYRKY